MIVVPLSIAIRRWSALQRMGEEEPLAGMLWVERIEGEALQDLKEDELFRRLGEGSHQ